MIEIMNEGDKIRHKHTGEIGTALTFFVLRAGVDMVWQAKTGSVFLGASRDWERCPPPQFEVGKKYRRTPLHKYGEAVLTIVGVQGLWAVGFYDNGNPASVSHNSLVEGMFEKVEC